MPLSQDDIKPVLKWTGGKRRLVENIRKFYQEKIVNDKIETYIEPFVGSGAVFFDVVYNFDIKKAYLFDTNPELIMLYLVIKNDVEKLISELKILSEKFYGLEEEKRKSFYYEKRDEYNLFEKQTKVEEYSKDWISRSALTIFLNKTCFTGLFRVNNGGNFNVPFGKYNMPVILNENNLLKVSKAFEIAEIKHVDFSHILDFADENTFVYLDPPYRPASTMLNFKSHGNDFGDSEHRRLKETFDKVSDKGGKLLLSTSDPTCLCEDYFFDDLYKEHNIKRLEKPFEDEYGADREIIITNY